MDTQGIGTMAGGVIGFLCFVLYLERKKRNDPQQMRLAQARASDKASAASWEGSFRKTRVLVDGDAVRVVRANSQTEEVRLAELRSASLVTAFYSGRCLHEIELRDVGRAVTVPQLAEGFDALVQRLELLPTYDRAAFQAGLRDKARQRRVLFRGKLPVDARLHSTGPQKLQEALTSGFVLGGGDERLSLDETLEQLSEKRGTTYQKDAHEYGYLHTGPIAIGDLRLSDLMISLASGLANRPMRGLHGYLVLAADDASYWSVKRYLQECLGEGQGDEGGKQSRWSWTIDGLQFAISYLYDSETTVESGACSLTIDNLRSYPEYLLDDCHDDVDLHEVQALILPFELTGPTRDFRRCAWVKQTPPAILSLLDRGGNFVVWNDRKHRKIGFARRGNALILPYEEVGTIHMVNALPAKGGGYSQLRIAERSTQNDRWSGHVAGSAGTGELPQWQAALEENLGMPIQREKDFYDA